MILRWLGTTMYVTIYPSVFVFIAMNCNEIACAFLLGEEFSIIIYWLFVENGNNYREVNIRIYSI